MNLDHLNQLVVLNAVRERHPAAVAVEACLKSDRKDVCRLLMDMAKQGVGGINRKQYADSVRRVRDNLPDDGTDLKARLSRLACGLDRETPPEYFGVVAGQSVPSTLVAELVRDVWSATTGQHPCAVADPGALLTPSPSRAAQVCALGTPVELPNQTYRLCDTLEHHPLNAIEQPRRARFTKSDYENQVLDGADFTGMNLTGSSFQHASLRNAKFVDSDLSSAYFFEADLTGADFNGATLTGADLGHTNLTGAKMDGTYVESTTVSGANLSGIDLRGLKGRYSLWRKWFEDRPELQVGTIWPEGT